MIRQSDRFDASRIRVGLDRQLKYLANLAPIEEAVPNTSRP